MTQEEFLSIDWQRGNVARLTNGKEYTVRKFKSRRLLLFSEEFQKHFTADFRIVESRTSDYVEPKEETETKENTQRPVTEKKEPVVKQEQAAEAPVKRKRQRIRVSAVKANFRQ